MSKLIKILLVLSVGLLALAQLILPTKSLSAGNSDFGIIIAGADDQTGLIQTQIGNQIRWTIEYFNNGPQSNSATINFPLNQHQAFVIGSITVPVGWSISYSTQVNCATGSFTYTPVGANGATDTQVKCIQFVNDNINSPANNSETVELNVTAANVGGTITSFGVGDVFKIEPFGNKVYSMLHHAYSDVPYSNEILSCFDLEANSICNSINPNITYPVALGMEGIGIGDQLGVSIAGVYGFREVGSKLYFPYGDDLGGGIMCWDPVTDDYCTGGGLNVRGQMQLHNRPWSESNGWDGLGTFFSQGVTFDLEYDPATNNLYSLAIDGTIVCYDLDAGTPCSGQPYATALPYVPNGPNGGHILLHNNRIYASLNGDWQSAHLTCLDLATEGLCSGWGSLRDLSGGLPHDGVPFFVLDNRPCVYIPVSWLVPTEDPHVYCYNQGTDTFDQRLTSITNSRALGPWYLHDQGYPGRFYFVGWGNRMYCYLTDTNTTVGQECPNWIGGKPTPITWTTLPDDQIYSATYIGGCLFMPSDKGWVHVVDPETGGLCGPNIITASGTNFVTLDAENMYCATDSDDISWNQLQVNDGSTLPVPLVLNADIYDADACTVTAGVVSCAGSPLLSADLLTQVNHSLDISSIDYADHPDLTAVIQYNYLALPSPMPTFTITMNQVEQPQMCMRTRLMFSNLLCTQIINQACGNTNISYASDPNGSNNAAQSCLGVDPYFGKDGATSAVGQVCVINPQGNMGGPSDETFTGDVIVVSGPAGGPGTGTGSGNGNGTGTGNGTGNGSGSGSSPLVSGIGQLRDTISQLLQTTGPEVPLIANVIVIAASGLLIAIPVLGINGPGGFLQLLGIIAGALLPKRHKYWGFVFDSTTNRPIPFAIINLLKADSLAVVKSTLADLNGKYRLNVDNAGSYIIQVDSPGYVQYKRTIGSGITSFLQSDIVADIALLRVEHLSNPLTKLIAYNKQTVLNLLSLLTLALSVSGLIITASHIYAEPNIINIVFGVIYILLFAGAIYPFIHRLQLKQGKVVDLTTKTGLAGASVRAYDDKGQIELVLTNNQGIARFSLKPGSYMFLANKRGYLMQETKDHKFGLMKIAVLPEGYLEQNIAMQKQADFVENSGILDNPFA